MKDVKLTNGTLRIIGYNNNVEIYYWKDGNNGEADSSFVIFADNCHDFTTNENIEDFIYNFEYVTYITKNEIDKITEALRPYIYPMSSEIYEDNL